MVKLAFGSLGDSFSATSIKAYVSEFIATLLFVFAGVGSAIAYGESQQLRIVCTHQISV
jgi:aquaporin TIP